MFDGYCGALIGMIQTSRGRIVLPVQSLFEHNRHAIVTFNSADDGKTWQRGNIIDLGGRGDHDGALEPTVAELKNGRLLMLLRTNLDRFWEAYSDDGGRYWRELRPSQIEASSSPGWLMRLASGRLVLVWNRLYPERENRFGHAGRLVSGPRRLDNNRKPQPVGIARSFPWLFPRTMPGPGPSRSSLHANPMDNAAIRTFSSDGPASCGSSVAMRIRVGSA